MPAVFFRKLKNMFKKIFATVAIAASVALSLISINAYAQDAADEVIRKNVNDVLAALKSDKDLQSGDIKKIEKLAEDKILPHFNFPHMTQLAVGRNWKDASDAQKTSLTDQFRTLLLRTYSSTLSQYRNQTIDVKPLKASADAEVVVKTAVIQSGGQPIPIDYSMEKTPSGWKVYDVLIDGVSLVTNYRSSFNTEIKTNGIDGLIKSLTARNTKNASKQ
jgi:phospholipid transport system substrate-binding protein